MVAPESDRGGWMDEPTVQQIINGFRMMPGSVEERATALASYLSKDRAYAVVERIEGSMAHIDRMTLYDDFETWRLNGYMGDPYREIRERFRIDMGPTAPLNVAWEETGRATGIGW